MITVYDCVVMTTHKKTDSEDINEIMHVLRNN